MLPYILAASLLIMLVALSGKLVTIKSAGRFMERNLHFLVSFSAGVLLVVTWRIVQEIVEHEGSLMGGVPWILAAACVVLLAFRLVPQFHHHHDKEEHAHSRIDANRILISDAIHNIGDGVVLVVSYSASLYLGLVATVSILVHEALQETSQFFVLREAGLSTRRALLYNLAVSSTILVGTFGGYYLIAQFRSLEIPLLGLAAGSYLVVVFHDLIPHSIGSAQSTSHYIKHAVFFIAGALLMASLVLLLPHPEL